MGYYALVIPAFVGHTNPMSVLGRALMRRRHRVVAISQLDAHDRLRRAGLEFLPLGEKEFPRGEWERRTAWIGELSGLAGSRFVCRWLADNARAIIRDLPLLIERERFDGIVMDQICIGAEAVCQAKNVPLAVACSALAGNPEWAVPPVTSFAMPGKSLFAKLRNVLEYTITNSTGIPIALALAPYRHRHKLGQMRMSHMNRMHPSLVQVAQQPAFFDFPRDYLPEHFHFTGPWVEASPISDDRFPWERLDGRPLIYASLGTLQNRLDWLFTAIAEACVGLEAQLVIALGRKDGSIIENLPGNPLVVSYAPQAALLKRAAMVVTHGGLNTTLETIREGLPMVVIPIAHDQPGVSARVVHLGLGERMRLKEATPEKIRAAVTRVLSGNSYRQTAQRCAAELKKVNGPEAAAELVERAFLTKQPVLANHFANSCKRATASSAMRSPVPGSA